MRPRLGGVGVGVSWDRPSTSDNAGYVRLHLSVHYRGRSAGGRIWGEAVWQRGASRPLSRVLLMGERQEIGSRAGALIGLSGACRGDDLNGLRLRQRGRLRTCRRALVG